MDNIPEREQLDEPRSGITPFAGGIERQVKGGLEAHIKYKSFLLRDIGKFYMLLTQPSINTLKYLTNKDDRALTIDLAGAVKRGNLRDFLRQGYFEVVIVEENPNPSDITEEAPREEMKLNLWINDTPNIIPFKLVVAGRSVVTSSTYLMYDEKGKWYEQFVLPNNPELLKAVRINLSSQQEGPIEPNSG